MFPNVPWSFWSKTSLPLRHIHSSSLQAHRPDPDLSERVEGSLLLGTTTAWWLEIENRGFKNLPYFLWIFHDLSWKKPRPVSVPTDDPYGCGKMINHQAVKRLRRTDEEIVLFWTSGRGPLVKRLWICMICIDM